MILSWTLHSPVQLLKSHAEHCPRDKFTLNDISTQKKRVCMSAWEV